MSLERKDIRAKLDPDWHDALSRAAARDGLEIGEFVEREITKILMQRIHQFILDKAAFDGIPATGKIRDEAGKLR
jgi:uncharacterized protein (DUF1778 family)